MPTNHPANVPRVAPKTNLEPPHQRPPNGSSSRNSPKVSAILPTSPFSPTRFPPVPAQFAESRSRLPEVAGLSWRVARLASAESQKNRRRTKFDARYDLLCLPGMRPFFSSRRRPSQTRRDHAAGNSRTRDRFNSRSLYLRSCCSSF